MIDLSDFSVLETSTILKDIGDFPQIIRIDKAYKLGLESSIDVFANYKGSIPKKIPNLHDCLVLHPKSKLTDLVSCSLGPGNDLIISEKLKTLLAHYELGPLKFYKCNLLQGRNKIEEYYWIHFLYDLMKEVLFAKSEFRLGSDVVTGIGSYQDYVNFSSKHDPFGFLRATKLFLPSKFKKLDFFMIGGFDQNVYLSEALAKVMIKQKFTGIFIKT